MNLDKLKSIKISLMNSVSDINEETNKADYIVKASATFKITKEFLDSAHDNNDLIESLTGQMFNDLLSKNPEINADTIGLWIDYDGEIKENAIKLITLSDMDKYSVDDITPIYEFFKLTLDV